MSADPNRAAGAWVTEQSRRAVVRVWILLGVFGASLLGGALAARLGWLSTRQGAGAGVGLCALALLAVWAAERRSEQAIAWLTGSRAEREIGKDLDLLKLEGAVVFHDVDIERGNIDHVVVIPRGVYVVETKLRRYEDRHLKQVKRQAHWLHEQIGRTWVTPVICLATRTDRPYRRDGVWVMGRPYLGSWLLRRGGHLVDTEQVRRALAA